MPTFHWKSKLFESTSPLRRPGRSFDHNQNNICKPLSSDTGTSNTHTLTTWMLRKFNKSKSLYFGYDCFPSASWLIAATPSFTNPAQNLGAIFFLTTCLDYISRIFGKYPPSYVSVKYRVPPPADPEALTHTLILASETSLLDPSISDNLVHLQSSSGEDDEALASHVLLMLTF